MVPEEIDLSGVLARNRIRLIGEDAFVLTYIITRLLKNPAIVVMLWAAIELDPELSKLMREHLTNMANNGRTWPLEKV